MRLEHSVLDARQPAIFVFFSSQNQASQIKLEWTKDEAKNICKLSKRFPTFVKIRKI